MYKIMACRESAGNSSDHLGFDAFLKTHTHTHTYTQVDSAPKKDGISDSMKARLMAEASTGLDSNQKQPNVILYIGLGIAVLVVLGGAGIFY